MAAAGSSAVFFLGTRAHYQVLQQPDTRSYDLENGNASTETIYQNPSVQELWPGEQNRNAAYHNDHHWGCYENGDVTLSDEKDRISETSNSDQRYSKRRQSETTLCERDNEMRPALLNNISGSFTSKPKSSRRRLSLLAFLSSLARRKRRLDSEQIQYLQHLESAFNTCTYRESCRCLDCQSRYFDCDESEEYSSGESEYAPQYVAPEPFTPQYPEEDNDEVFVDTVPDDSTSADMLLEAPPPPAKMSVSSDEIDPEDDMQLEVAAGTPVLLNYLLTHPITCAIQ